MGCPVTTRINMIKQPYGGYVKTSEFTIIKFDDQQRLHDVENVHGSIVGMAVDYLTRFSMGADISDAFKISINGAAMASKLGFDNIGKYAKRYISEIHGMDDLSIINACKMVTFDVWIRNTLHAPFVKGSLDINPDKNTIENIRIMVNRSILFFKKYGPIMKDGFSFEDDGYTDTVSSGDGDFLTSDTLWDFKVSRSKPTSKHTLQILMYWIMGKHSKKHEFLNISKIGIFNPRLNIAYILDTENIPKSIITEIEQKVIVY